MLVQQGNTFYDMRTIYSRSDAPTQQRNSREYSNVNIYNDSIHLNVAHDFENINLKNLKDKTDSEEPFIEEASMGKRKICRTEEVQLHGTRSSRWSM